MWLYDEEEEKRISYYRLIELFKDEGADAEIRDRIKEIVASRKPQDDTNDTSTETLLKKVAYQTYAKEFDDTVTPDYTSLRDRVKGLVTTPSGNDYDKLDEILEEISFEDLAAIINAYEGIVKVDETHKEIADHIKGFAKVKIINNINDGIDTENADLRQLDAMYNTAADISEELGNDFAKLRRQYNHAILINKSEQIEVVAQKIREDINSDENGDFNDIKELWNGLNIASIGENNLPTDEVVSEEGKQDHWNIMLESAIAKVMHDNLRTLELEQEAARVAAENSEEGADTENNDENTSDDINPKLKYNLSIISNKDLIKQVEEQLREDIITLYVANAVDKVANMPEVLSELGLTDLPNPGEEPAKPTEEELESLSDEDKKTKLEAYEAAKKEYDEKSSQLKEEIKTALSNLDDKNKINKIVKKLQEEMNKDPEGQQSKILVNPFLIMDTASERETALSILRKDIFRDYRRKDSKVGAAVREQENKLAESSRKVFGKLHDFAVGIRQLAKNDTAKAIEVVSQLGVAGGNMAFAGISLFGGKEALASVGGQAFAGILAGVMVANQIAKGTAYPLARAYNNLQGSKLKGWAKFKAACSEVNRKEPEWWINAATGVVAAGAWATVSAVASPLAGKIVASGVVAIGNYVAKQTEFNRRKNLLKLLENSKPQSAKDVKLIGELRTELYGNKEQEKTKGILGKIKALLQPKKNQTILAGVGAGFGALGIVGQVSNIMTTGLDNVVPPSDTTNVVPPSDTTNVVPPSDITNVVPPSDTTNVVPPSDTTNVVPPSDTTNAVPPSDTTNVVPPSDTTNVVPPADTTNVVPPSDTTNAVPPSDTTNVVPPADTTNVVPPTDTNGFTPTVDDKTGMTIWKEPVTKNGVTETYLQDAKGRTFVRYEGLDTSHKVPEATYAKLIDTINSKGNMNIVMKDGSQYTFEEAVAMMREKLDAYPDRLPEGMGKNQAIYLAMMRARFVGKTDILDDIKCNDGELTMLVAESQKYATNPGHIGQFITDRPLPTKVGPASVIGDPCTPNMGQTRGLDIKIEGVQQEVVSNNATVDMENPHADAGATYASKRHRYDIALDSIASDGSEVKGADVQKFVTFVNDKDGIRLPNGTESFNNEVQYYAPHDVREIISNLKTPTSVVTDDTTGVTTISYEFEKGETVSVVLDKANAEGTRVGHFLIGDKECIVDTQSSQALTSSLTESGVAGATYVSIDSDNVVPEGMPAGHSKIDTKIGEIAAAQEGLVAPEETPATRSVGVNPTTEVVPVQLSDAQVDAIKYGENTQFTCTAIKDGKAVLAVSGVEGFDGSIKVAEPVHLNMEGATYASEGISTYSTEKATVTINTADSKEIKVIYEQGKAIATMGDTPVLLDSKTCESVEQLTNQAFRDKHVSINVDLHSDFTDKIVTAVETFRSNEQSTTKTIASSMMHQTRSGNKGMA